MRYYYHTNDKNTTLAHSHYSDPAYDGNGAIIFGREVKGMQWEYADRLRQWDYDKADASWEAAKEAIGNTNTAAAVESYLRHYFDDGNLELLCIRTGTQQFNGYPWFAYGFKRSTEVQS